MHDTVFSRGYHTIDTTETGDSAHELGQRGGFAVRFVRQSPLFRHLVPGAFGLALAALGPVVASAQEAEEEGFYGEDVGELEIEGPIDEEAGEAGWPEEAGILEDEQGPLEDEEVLEEEEELFEEEGEDYEPLPAPAEGDDFEPRASIGVEEEDVDPPELDEPFDPYDPEAFTDEGEGVLQ